MRRSNPNGNRSSIPGNPRIVRFVLIGFVTLLGAGCAGIRPPRDAIRTRETLLTTGYSKDPESTGWHRNWFLRPTISSGPNRGKRKAVGITASGTKARPGTLAADTSLYPFGTVMKIPGYGYGRVEDRGGAIRGRHIDLYFKSRKEALRWGKRTQEVQIWIPRK